MARVARTTSRRSPLLKGRTPGVWYPDLVGKIRGYPKTEEVFQKRVDLMRQQIKLYNAEGIAGRSGVPDGWAGKKKLINEINTKSQAEAESILDGLEAEGRWKPDNLEAKVALRGALAILVAEKYTPENRPVPLYSAKERLAAQKLVLEYTQRKPVSTTIAVASTAEDFLKELSTK